MTSIETRMYKALRRAGYNPIPQYRVGKYALDFAIFKNGIQLDVECDGKDFHSSPLQKEHDRLRTQFLNRQGWNVIRFTGKQIFRDIYKCVKRVDKKLGVTNHRTDFLIGVKQFGKKFRFTNYRNDFQSLIKNLFKDFLKDFKLPKTKSYKLPKLNAFKLSKIKAFKLPKIKI